ncbi:hypothetical protein BGZ70_006871 [Mortierella alpina]|uniref:Uncharacterized protein n=1 Tax=Mortierella alpina TaxID=64518 RepID=A0A9P6M6U0_MORAP|nr:hypothetical protein BGZ70_006871 [Mortierella alpina]
MATPIAPPAAFGLVSGTAYASTSPEALEAILEHLDLGSIEQENFRLERAIQQLVQSNREIAEFMEQERQEQEQGQGQEHARESGGESQLPGFEPDPEFVQAIEENKEVIAKYERVCTQLKKAIAKKRGEERRDKQLEEVNVVEEGAVAQGGGQGGDQGGDQKGVFL